MSNAYTEDQLGTALINAHNAGDEDAARTLANAILQIRASKTPQPGSSPSLPLDTVEQAAGPGTIARASLAPDPKVQIQRYAEAFNQPVSDFGIVGDHIVRRVPDTGQYARVEPSVSGASNPIDAAKRAFDWVAGGTGQAIPAVGAGVGVVAGGLAGIESGPGALATAMAGGAAGSSLGEVARQKLDHALAPKDDQTPMDWGNVGWQGLAGASGPVVGKGIEAVGGRIAPVLADTAANELPANATERAALTAGTAPVPEPQGALGLAPDAIKSIQGHILSIQGLLGGRAAAAAEFKVEPTVGQFTGSKVAQAAERQSAGLVPFMQDFANKAIDQNTVQTPRAVNMMLDDIAPNASASDQIGGFRSAADDVIKQRFKAQSAEAAPIYEAALDGKPPFWSDDLTGIMMRPSMKAGWAEAQKNAAEEGYTLPALFKTDANGATTLNTEAAPTWRDWQNIKIGLNDAIKAQTDDLTGKLTPDGRRLVQTKSDLMDVLYKANPDWRAADAKYGSASDITDAMLNGGAGAIKRMTGADRQSMITGIFTPGNKILPDAIPSLRQQFIDAGHRDEWMGGVRNYIANGFDQASKSTGSAPDQMNVAAKFYNGFWGNPQQNEVITNALGGPTAPLAQRWGRLGEAMEMLSHRLPEGSRTATDIGAPTLASQGGAFNSVMSLLGGTRAASENLISGLGEMQKQGNARKFAEYALNSDKGMEMLRKLATVPTDSPRARSILSSMLMEAGGVGGEDQWSGASSH